MKIQLNKANTLNKDLGINLNQKWLENYQRDKVKTWTIKYRGIYIKYMLQKYMIFLFIWLYFFVQMRVTYVGFS